MNNPPTRFRFSEDQSEAPVRFIAGSLQMPTAGDHCSVGTQNRRIEVGES